MPECVPCAPCQPAAGIKCGPADSKGVDGKQERPCDCHTCCCGKPKIVKPCYKQPKVPDNYAPRRCYQKPTAPVEGSTTYKLSYLPVAGLSSLRSDIKRPPGNITRSTEPMEGYTVQRMSYLPNPVCVPTPFRPCNHDMWGEGPMQQVTTQRHDYVPKPCEKRESFKPLNQVHVVEEPFQSATINRLSYLPPSKMEPVKNFAPQRCYERPVAKMEGATTANMSYLPNKIMPKEPMPWAEKGTYTKPCTRMDGGTTYGLSYLDAKADCRRQPIVPNTQPVAVNARFENMTVYKNSYLPAKVPIPTPFKPPQNLVRSDAKMEGETVQKMSYLPNPVCVPVPFRPCNHDMWGEGPMQNLTTQRHDYVPKPIAVRQSFKPDNVVHVVDEPLESKTINRLSFLDPGRQQKAPNYAPVRCYEKPTAPMECSTTQKLSYLPVHTQSRQTPPWACKAGYQKPCTRFEGNTVYKSSYLPPGEDCTEVVEDTTYGTCLPCECTCPATCIKQDPCACDFPRAECCA